jgi:hypothetical protein
MARAGLSGYWMAAADGGVFSFGGAPFAGSAGGQRLNQPVVGVAGTPTGGGYWLTAGDGGVFAFGDAPYAGSAGGVRLSAPVVGIAATPSGLGYWLVARDGGVFSFGDAGFFGSTGSSHLNQPIVNMAPTPSGRGYWLVARDGGVFSFGDAGFFGSTGSMRLAQPITTIISTTTGLGYWMAGRDGGVFSFGDAPFLGSMVKARPVNVSRVTTPNVYRAGGRGYDMSWPQCGQALPAPGSFTVVGITGGKAYTHNPCIAELARWGRGTPLSAYINVNGIPGPGLGAALQGPAGSCPNDDLHCQAYNYGYHDVTDAIADAHSAGFETNMWWLDVETMNSWSSDRDLNARVIDGALDAVAANGGQSGVYSTAYQWGVIAGGYTPGVPVWVAGATASSAASGCRVETAFAGGTPWLVQYNAGGFDGNYAC